MTHDEREYSDTMPSPASEPVAADPIAQKLDAVLAMQEEAVRVQAQTTKALAALVDKLGELDQSHNELRDGFARLISPHEIDRRLVALQNSVEAISRTCVAHKLSLAPLNGGGGDAE